MMPLFVEKFTEALILTPLLTFLICLGYSSINLVSILMENPFGDDAGDLPLVECHECFNCRMEDANEIGGDEELGKHLYGFSSFYDERYVGVPQKITALGKPAPALPVA